MNLTEHFEKIPFLLSMFLPVIIFFLFGLWLARRKHREDYIRLKIATEENDHLAADLTRALAPEKDMSKTLLGHIEAQKDDWTTTIQTTRDDLSTEQCRTRDLRSQIRELQEAAEQNDSKLETEKDAQIQALQEAQNNLENELETFSTANAEFQQEYTQNQQLIEQLQNQITELSAQDSEQIQQLESQLEEQNQAIAQLTSQLADAQAQQPASSDQDQLQSDLAEAQQLSEQQQSHITELETELTSLHKQHTEAETRLSQQQQDLAELQVELELAYQASPSAPVQTSLPLSPQEDTHIDDTLGLLYTTRPGRIDDLKLIKGIGKVLENKLHKIGIYRFKQVATWSPQQVRAFDKRLSFKKRIERDHWLDQATRLHREQYGEDL